jgi:peptidoglycan hydrolase-like protein with peptidoglycan-binding domain
MKLRVTGGAALGKVSGTSPRWRRNPAFTSGIAASATVFIGGIAVIGGCTTSPPSHPAGTAPAATRPAAPAPPARVVAVSPARGATGVNGTQPIQVTYSRPLPASPPLPRISPAIPGTWLVDGAVALFTPAAGFPPKTKVTVSIPAAIGTATTVPASALTESFTTARYSTLRLQQLLAELGYLPLTWTPAPHSAIDATSPAQQLAAAYDPPAGAFTWAAGGWPRSLRSFWTAGTPNTMTRGAITGFEADHGLPTDGDAGPVVWRALLKAAAAGQANPHGYSYAIAREGMPETLTIWHDGTRVFHSLANTGIGIAPTPLGTFPVYEKLPFQIMSGTNPDGSHYADPVKWVSYFSGGSAVHYFDRGSYGWPQSLGCVELPYRAARQAYPYLPYGTLVTVIRLPAVAFAGVFQPAGDLGVVRPGGAPAGFPPPHTHPNP